MLQKSFSNACPCTKHCQHDTTQMNLKERETAAERSKLEPEE